MKELEYLANKKEVQESYLLCEAAYLCKYGQLDCDEKGCCNCEFDKNPQHCCEVLLTTEHKECIKLTKNEKAILESLEDKYELIARSDSGNLNAFDNTLKCHEKDNLILCDMAYVNLSAFNHLFKFIPPNGEPMLIKQLLVESEII